MNKFLTILTLILTFTLSAQGLKSYKDEAGKYGFVDSLGNKVGAVIYDFTWDFAEGFARVFQNGKYGYVNRKCELVVPCRYAYADYSFFDGFARVNSGGVSEENNVFGEVKGGKWGLVDSTGKELIAPAFDNIGYFDKGLIAAKQNGKWGYIDITGKKVIPFVYDEVSFFIGDFVEVRLKGKCGYIDKKGEIIIPIKHRMILPLTDFSSKDLNSLENLVAVAKGKKFGFFDLENKKQVISFIYDEVDSDVINGLIRVARGAKLGFVNTSGKEVVPPIYDEIEFISNNAVKVLKDNLWGIFDNKGKQVLPLKFENINFAQTAYCIKINGKYGMYTLDGKEFIPAIYEDGFVFFEGKAFVGLDGRDFFIDEKGNEIKEEN